jgi:hypothetical protein
VDAGAFSCLMNNWRIILSYRTEQIFEPGARVRLREIYYGKPIGSEGTIIESGAYGCIVRFEDNEPTAYDRWGMGYLRTGYNVRRRSLELI